MTKPSSTRPFSFVLLLAFVQLLDILVHIAVDQVEPIRVASNLIILAWLVFGAAGLITEPARYISIGVIGVYLLLNFIFLGINGITNPAQGGALRLPLFAFMGFTVVLGIWLVNRANK